MGQIKKSHLTQFEKGGTYNPTTTTQEPKIIGVYDMLGRPVKHIRKEEIMILLYDDGSTKKIIQK
jgi:hypothetical protein